jgi:hypothetical protein
LARDGARETVARASVASVASVSCVGELMAEAKWYITKLSTGNKSKPAVLPARVTSQPSKVVTLG